jgi:hypothetical protein
MDGWMDGWMDAGWIQDGWILNACMDECRMYGWMVQDRRMMDGWIPLDGWMNAWMDGCMDGCVDG